MTYGHGGPTDPFGGDPFAGAPVNGAPLPPAPAPAREVNVLATLSVIFAFVFAPAGVVLGHLGLAQIGHTGQRGRDRALVGLTLSYVFIAVAVVSLVVWMTLGTTSTPSPIASQSAPAPPSTAPSVATTTTSASPPPAGPTLTVLDPPGPLLNVDEMKVILGTPANKYATPPVPVSDLAAYLPLDVVDNDMKIQGTVDDSACAAAVFAATGQAFGNLDPFQAIHSVTMAQPGAAGTQSVTETAVDYATAAEADAALAGYLKLLDPCKGRRTVTLTTAPQGAVHTLALGGEGPHQYTFAGDDDPRAAGQEVWMFRHESTDGFAVERGFLVKGNVLVDVSVRGLGLFADQQEVLGEILKKIT